MAVYNYCYTLYVGVMKVRKLVKGRRSMIYCWYRYCAYSLKDFREAEQKAYEKDLERERLTGVRSPFIDFYEERYLTKQNGCL